MFNCFPTVIGSLAVNPRLLLHEINIFVLKTTVSPSSPDLEIKVVYNLAYLWLQQIILNTVLMRTIHHSCARFWQPPNVRFSNTPLTVDVGFCVFYPQLELNITWFASNKCTLLQQSFAMFFFRRQTWENKKNNWIVMSEIICNLNEI